MLHASIDPSINGRVLVSRPVAVGEHDWADGLTRFLARRSIAVEWAQTGREAIGLVERGGIDAAILSARMHQMDGLSVLRIIRSVNAGLPCLMITADASKRALQQALALGAYSIVTEPVNLDELTRVTTGMFRKYCEWNLD